MSICNGIAGKRDCEPIGFFIHNDAGGASLDADYWANAYKTGKHDLNNGFVHYHVDTTHIVQCEDDENKSWHCGNAYYNNMYLSLEVDQSMGLRDNDFLIAETRALKFVAEKFKEYRIEPNAQTVMLHKEVYPTACPHRSVEIHGGDKACKEYFINKIKEFMNGEEPKKGVDDMVCLYLKPVDGNKWWYYFDGTKVRGPLYDPSQITVLDDIYKANHDGKGIPVFDWTNPNAPWFARLEQVMHLSEV